MIDILLGTLFITALLNDVSMSNLYVDPIVTMRENNSLVLKYEFVTIENPNTSSIISAVQINETSDALAA